MSSRSLIRTNVDFDADGFQRGTLRIPYSSDRSAYGHIPVPIMIAANGAGPSVLLMGGNHGDEFEGPVALQHLMKQVRLEDLSGRLLFLPSLNLPALRAGRRTSPLDSGNLNRSFPGNRTGTPTEMLAHFLESELFPKVDFVFDFHSGGASLAHLPILFLRRPRTESETALTRRVAAAFGCERVRYLNFEFGEGRTSMEAILRAKKFFISGEFGGGGSLSSEGVKLIRQGTVRVLHELGVLRGDHVEFSSSGRHPAAYEFFAPEHHVYAPCSGLFEAAVSMGQAVDAGQFAGVIHDPVEPWRDARELYFKSAGVVICMRHSAVTDAGDCLVQLAVPIESPV